MYVILLAVLAWQGSPILASVFIALALGMIIVHALWVCPKCGNYGCDINPKSPHFFLGAKKPEPPREKRPALNTIPFQIILSFMLGLGIYAVWLVSLHIAAIMGLAGALLFYAYSRDACRGCPNKCLMARS
jgi:hypothetical protein